MSPGNAAWVIVASALGLVLLAAGAVYAHHRWLRFSFRRRHAPEGRFILFVYSDSPHWKDYVESEILPRVARHAVVLNWSERRKWEAGQTLEAKVFRHWAGTREFNPIAIIFPPSGRVRVIRFWRAFRDYKHGKRRPLERAREELFAAVEEHEGKAV